MKNTDMYYMTIRFPGIIASAVLMVFLLVACSSDPEPSEPTDIEPASLSIGFMVASPYNGWSRADSEQTDNGIPAESAINFAGGSYRVYFFDKDDAFITSWSQISEMHVIKGLNYWEYTFTGKVPDKLQPYHDFKVMVLANWPSYPEYKGISLEGMKIADIVTADWSQFTALNEFELSVESGRLIPFYGLKNYSGVEFEENNTYDLGEINLVRAMAKVEVIVKDLPDNTTISGSPLIVGRNSVGYCGLSASITTESAPSSVNLIDGKNDDNATLNAVRMLDTKDINGNDEVGRWIAYVPEFRNKNEDSIWEYSSISLPLTKVTQSDEGSVPTVTPFSLYFSKYDKYGAHQNDKMSERFDICRNYWYRFIVSKDEVGLTVQATVVPYVPVDLEVDFGIPSTPSN